MRSCFKKTQLPSLALDLQALTSGLAQDFFTGSLSFLPLRCLHLLLSFANQEAAKKCVGALAPLAPSSHLLGVLENLGARVKGTNLRHLGFAALLLPCLLPWLHPDPPACSPLT